MTQHRPGWYALLQGDEIDLDYWLHSLKEPFDPVAVKLPDGQTVLRSIDFAGLNNASEVRERALILIGTLNGAMKLSSGARSLIFGGIVKIDESGKQHIHMFMEAALLENRFDVMGATLVAYGPDGKPLPPPPPVPSKTQIWNRIAQDNDLVSDLLDHFGRADYWYEIYKTIEYARLLVGSDDALKNLLGENVNLENLKRNANFHRHARFPAPKRILSLKEAKSMLGVVVSTTLSAIASELE